MNLEELLMEATAISEQIDSLDRVSKNYVKAKTKSSVSYGYNSKEVKEYCGILEYEIDNLLMDLKNIVESMELQ